ncbi:MAG: GGDEF domain-containing protein [Desulfohalobiaceae bacterium]
MGYSEFDMQDLVLNIEFQDILSHSRITVVYQPIINFKTGGIYGWEALSRGPKNSSFYSPLYLFSFAEESGSLFQLEKICREKAIKSCGKLSIGQKLFLNIHPQTLSDPDFTPGETKRILKSTNLNPENVVFEITERHAIHDFKLFNQTLKHYRSQGFLIAVDDVGAGYSGLVSLARIRPDFIKIDKSLVFDVHKDPVKKALLETFVTFADKIEAKIIAEGIETHNSLKMLSELGVHLGQGFYIARPDYPPPEVDFSHELTSKLEIPESSRCHLPVSGLVQTVPAVDEHTRVDEIRNMFEAMGPLASIVVQRNSRPIGLVMSHQLDRKLSTRYGVALYFSRQVTAIMDKNPLIVDASMTIEAVAQMTIERKSSKTYDDVIVTRQGQLLGVVSVRQLIDSMASFQVEMAKGSNPLTGLPGNMALEAEIEKRLDLGRPFNLVYIDLDNFKAYNDTYGFQDGDQMILLLSKILQRCQRRYGQPSDFIGHIGGDDLVLVTSVDPARFCLGVVRCFERAKRNFFTQEDRSKGCVYALGRNNKIRKHPLVTVSMGILQVKGPTSLQKISERSADVKKYAKSVAGSSYVYDRRSALGQDPWDG